MWLSTELRPGDYAYFATDHLGSVRGVYDASKVMTAALNYTPYGQPRAWRGDTPSPTYTGHHWDGETSMYFAPYRYLMPDAGRWLTRDPLGMVDGPNVYGYVLNTPLGRVDKTGLASSKPNACQQQKQNPSSRAGKFCQDCCFKKNKHCMAGASSPSDKTKCDNRRKCCSILCNTLGHDASGPDGAWAWSVCKRGFKPKPPSNPPSNLGALQPN